MAMAEYRSEFRYHGDYLDIDDTNVVSEDRHIAQQNIVQRRVDPADEEDMEALRRNEIVITVTGARQIGKSYIIAIIQELLSDLEFRTEYKHAHSAAKRHYRSHKKQMLNTVVERFRDYKPRIILRESDYFRSYPTEANEVVR